MNRYIIEENAGFYSVLDSEEDYVIVFSALNKFEAEICADEMNIDWNGG